VAEAIYTLCAAASVLCAALLLRGYLANRTALLFWSSLCFVGLAINNLLLLVDLVLLPAVELTLLRGLVAMAAIAVMVYGLVWEHQ
jgi:Family of unknown function (DUF5985)